MLCSFSLLKLTFIHNLSFSFLFSFFYFSSHHHLFVTPFFLLTFIFRCHSLSFILLFLYSWFMSLFQSLLFWNSESVINFDILVFSYFLIPPFLSYDVFFFSLFLSMLFSLSFFSHVCISFVSPPFLSSSFYVFSFLNIDLVSFLLSVSFSFPTVSSAHSFSTVFFPSFFLSFSQCSYFTSCL